MSPSKNGVNHNGDAATAKRMVEAAAHAGADAVKFQTFSAARLASRCAPLAPYQQEAIGDGGSQYAMLEALELSAQTHRELWAVAQKCGIIFLSTPFDEHSADLLEALGVGAFKISSGELTNHRLLRHVARKGKPLILSTGMSTFADIESALAAIEGERELACALLHAVSAYPVPPEEANLRAIQSLFTIFGKPVGYSDHTTGIDLAPAAVALGACIIEKHFTLDRGLPGPDQAFSVEPPDLAKMIASIRRVEVALGDGRKRVTAREREVADCAKKSLAAARDLASGEVLDAQSVIALRPGTGIPTSAMSFVLGRTLKRDLPAGTLLSLEHLR